MAAVTGVDTGLLAATFACLRNARVQSAAPILDTFVCLATDLTEREADQLPLAVARVLPLLEADPDRLRVAIDVAVTFDLFEVADTLIQLAGTKSDLRALHAAAALVTNPGVEDVIHTELLNLARRMVMTHDQRRALEVRLDPNIKPFGPLETSLQVQRWPGSPHAGERPHAPMVAIDETGAPARLKWLLMADLRAAGVALRRIPTEWKGPGLEKWLSTRVPIITWEPEAFARIRRRYPELTSDQLLVVERNESSRFRALHLITQWFPSDLAVRRPQPLTGAEWRNPVDAGVYTLGSFDAHEMALLSGTRRAALYSTLRGALVPAQTIDGTHYWTFNQLVGLRSWQYFRQVAGRRNLTTTIIQKLIGFAGGPNPTAVGVTADGTVLRRAGKDWVDVVTDQIYLEPVRTLGDVFSAFEIGGGHVNVPGLLRPSEHSNVHPASVGGTPVVDGTRIPVRAIAELVRDQDQELAMRAYGLEAAIIADAAALGTRLLYV